MAKDLESPPVRMTRSRAKAAAKKPDLKITTAAAQAKRRGHLEEENLKKQVNKMRVDARAETSTGDAGSAECITVMSASSSTRPAAARGRPRKQAAAPPGGNETTSARSVLQKTSSSTEPETTSARATAAHAKKVAFSATKNEAEADTKPALSESKGRATIVRSGRRVTESKGKGFDAKPMRKPIGGLRRTKPITENASEARVEAQKAETNEYTMTAAAALPKGDSINVRSISPEREQKPSRPGVPLPAAPEASQEAPQKSPVKIKADDALEHGQKFGSSSHAQIATEKTALPARDTTMIAVQSPARRPPQSPFKHAMKESPKRRGHGNPLQETAPAPTPSLILKSPKKINLGRLPMGPAFSAHSQTEFTSSLFTSPARRPHSPPKGFPNASHSVRPEAVASLMTAMTTSAMRPNHNSITMFTPARTVVSAALKGSKSPEAAAKVHTMSPQERLEASKRTTMSIMPLVSKVPQTRTLVNTFTRAPRSPFVEAGSENHSRTQAPPRSPPKLDLSRPDTSPSHFKPPALSSQKVVAKPKFDFSGITSTTPAGSPVSRQMSHHPRMHHDSPSRPEEESEDELQSNDPQYDATPGVRRHTVAFHVASTPTPIFAPKAAVSVKHGVDRHTPNAVSMRRDPMSVLADRFSQWKGTASPDKRPAATKEGRSICSPVKSIVPSAKQVVPQTSDVVMPAEKTSVCLAKPMMSSHKPLMSPPKPMSSTTASTPSPLMLAASPAQPDIGTTRTSPERQTKNQSTIELLLASPERPSYFEEAMAIREDDEQADAAQPESFSEAGFFGQSQISAASQEYGDENVAPTAPLPSQLVAEPAPPACTPARVFAHPRQILHTITKVPLKPAAVDSPFEAMRPRQRRSQSESDTLTGRTDHELRVLRQLLPETVTVPLPADSPPSAMQGDETLTYCPPGTPSPQQAGLALLLTGSPSRTCRADINRTLLSGAVVYVDVHTAEGADASGVFVELLCRMGARCVKNWTWNPPAAGDQRSDDDVSPASAAKVGITHVVFKDGGRRTMDKVRQAKGSVACVGVGWVLE